MNTLAINSFLSGLAYVARCKHGKHNMLHPLISIVLCLCRKFIQMGMTRAKRYANHAGGRKYGKDGRELEKSTGHKDKGEKEESSAIFKEVWERCRKFEGYQRKKEAFQKEQKEWDREVKKEEGKVERVKEEDD